MNPTVGEIIPLYSTNWLDEILFNESRFKDSLADLGLDQESTRDDIAGYQAATELFRIPSLKPPNFYSPEGYGEWISRQAANKKELVLNRIKELLSGKKFVIEETATKQIDVPLFILRSPRVDRSKVTYSEDMATESEATWDVKVLGTGMGATTWFKVKHSATFESTDGDAKVIFVPVTVVVSKVVVYKNEKLLSTGLRCEMERIDRAKRFTKGIALIPAAVAAKQSPRQDAKGERFPLRGERRTSVATYSQEMSGSTKIETSLGVELFGLKTSAKAHIKQERKVTISFELPGGHDYWLKPIAGSHGIWWDTE